MGIGLARDARLEGGMMNRFSYFVLISVVLLLPVAVRAQTGGASVTMRASVSDVVNLSVAPTMKLDDVHVDSVSSGSTLRMTLSGSGARSSVVRVPLLVRSNTGFRIMATAESEAAVLTQVLVTDVRATGRLVSPEAVNNAQKSEIDLRLLRNGPVLVWSGPRVSLAGTLNSPNNAVQITLLIHIKPESVGSWMAHLTFFNN